MLKKLDAKQEAEVVFPEWQTYGYSFVPYAYTGMRRMMIRDVPLCRVKKTVWFMKLSIR